MFAACSIAEPIAGGTYSAPNSALGSAPGSVRASSDSAAASYGGYGGGGGSHNTSGSAGGSNGGWDWQLGPPAQVRIFVPFLTQEQEGTGILHTHGCFAKHLPDCTA